MARLGCDVVNAKVICDGECQGDASKGVPLAQAVGADTIIVQLAHEWAETTDIIVGTLVHVAQHGERRRFHLR